MSRASNFFLSKQSVQNSPHAKDTFWNGRYYFPIEEIFLGKKLDDVLTKAGTSGDVVELD